MLAKAFAIYLTMIGEYKGRSRVSVTDVNERNTVIKWLDDKNDLIRIVKKGMGK